MTKSKEFRIELETLSPFRIGGKKDPFSAADQPIAKIGDKIVVQGTSLKGALRQNIENFLIQEYSVKQDMKPCLPSSEKTMSEDEKELIRNGKYKGSSCHYPCRHEQKHSICPACYLLGAQGLVGFVTIPFLTANVTPNDLYAIRVDRATGVAASGTNRDYQIIPESTKFTGTLTVLLEDNVKGWMLGKKRQLKDVTLGDKWIDDTWSDEKIINDLIKKRFESIKVIGGLKSSGAGKVKISINPLEKK